MAIAMLLVAATGFAQTDTARINLPDTIHVGNFVIVKKNKGNFNFGDTVYRDNSIDIVINNHHRNHNSFISTNWLIFDLGFANWRDKTIYGSPAANAYLQGTPAFTKNDLRLNTVKSSNVNIWFFMQKLNITQHVLNLKYGLGLEMYNYRYETNISYNANPPYIFRDTVQFSKNKLYVGYLTVPFMLNINTSPSHRWGFSFSTGLSAGYRVGTHTKQISEEHGKVKNRNDFDLNPWRLAYVAEAGLGPVRLYGSYSINTLHQDGLLQYPYTVGIRFSNW